MRVVRFKRGEAIWVTARPGTSNSTLFLFWSIFRPNTPNNWGVGIRANLPDYAIDVVPDDTERTSYTPIPLSLRPEYAVQFDCVANNGEPRQIIIRPGSHGGQITVEFCPGAYEIAPKFANEVNKRAV